MSYVTLVNSYFVDQQVAAEHQSTELHAAGESYIMDTLTCLLHI